MKSIKTTDDNNRDEHVHDEIASYLDLKNPTSFFLFAGAGSGKTGSLVRALKNLQQSTVGKNFRLYGKRIGVITYTNAACDEIKQRTDFNTLIEVSTIHSFMWLLIRGLNTDIREWVRNRLNLDINELTEQVRKGRSGTKIAADREKSLESKRKRLAELDGIKRFIYNPNGDNRERDSLNHSEVIAIGAEFLKTKPLMQSLLVGKFPILLIDESQDTNRLLMDALFAVQEKHKAQFRLGLFGDTMQRIYGDGKLDLGINLPPDWKTPEMKMNHRCPRRIVQLINRIRSAVDKHQQVPRDDKPEGFVRLFLIKSEAKDKQAVECDVAKRMAAITKDLEWNRDNYKSLILEHHMAARRLGFFELFEPLYQLETARTALLDGSLSGLQFFARLILPLVNAERAGNTFAATAIVRKDSPLLNSALLKTLLSGQLQQLKKVRKAVKALMALFPAGEDPSLISVLQCVHLNGLFTVPESLSLIATQESADAQEEDVDQTREAWRKALKTPFSQIEKYIDYVDQKAPFDTHQGVKGREFPRVMVVMDDTEARGFLFSYDKLFGIKAKSETDLKNEQDGKETGIDRTRRLFYVTCSRAIESLALVAYSSNPAGVCEHVIREGWFETPEVVIL